MAMDHDVKVLVISGSMGSGKTTVLGEASDLLTMANILHAAIDLDYLAIKSPDSFEKVGFSGCEAFAAESKGSRVSFEFWAITPLYVVN
jgi:hypothetical protein